MQNINTKLNPQHHSNRTVASIQLYTVVVWNAVENATKKCHFFAVKIRAVKLMC